MASKPNQQSLNEQQKTLIVKKIEIQKLINETKFILKGHHEDNLKLKKSRRQKNPKMAQLEKRLSKLKADLKEVDQAISEKGSATKSVEIEQKLHQDSSNEIASLQNTNSSAPEETVQAVSTSFVSKDDDLVIRQPCRKCNGFIEKILDDNMRFIKLCNDLNEDNVRYNEKLKQDNQQIVSLTNQLDQMNKLYKKCLLENANKEKLIKAQDKVIADKDKVHQRFVDCSEETDTISKELISELETQKSENLAELEQNGRTNQ